MDKCVCERETTTSSLLVTLTHARGSSLSGIFQLFPGTKHVKKPTRTLFFLKRSSSKRGANSPPFRTKLWEEVFVLRGIQWEESLPRRTALVLNEKTTSPPKNDFFCEEQSTSSFSLRPTLVLLLFFYLSLLKCFFPFSLESIVAKTIEKRSRW